MPALPLPDPALLRLLVGPLLAAGFLRWVVGPFAAHLAPVVAALLRRRWRL